MAEYPKGTEPQQILQDAFEKIAKLKKINGLVIIYSGSNNENDDDDDLIFSHYSGGYSIVTGMAELFKHQCIKDYTSGDKDII